MYRIMASTGQGGNWEMVFNQYKTATEERNHESIPLMGELPVTEAGSSEELNQSGSVRFTLAEGHPLYGEIEPIATHIRVYEDAPGSQEEENLIFTGRVIQAGVPSFSGTIPYECEGALSFLMDSQIPPVKNPVSQTAESFFSWCIQKHNEDIGNDPRRTFEVGIVNVPDRTKTDKFAVSSYTETKTAIENLLINVYGGYLRVREDGEHRYIDWREYYTTRLNRNAIRIGENVIEKAFTLSGENLFTTIRPIGKNGIKMAGEETIDLFSTEMMNKYGKIVKTVTFSDAATSAALRGKATEYVSRLKKMLLCNGTIDLVDMYYLTNGNTAKVMLGERFNNIEGLGGMTVTISSLERDFMNPAEDNCTLDNDKAINDGSAMKNGSSTGGRSGRSASAAAGMSFKHIIEIGDQVQINASTLIMHGETLEEHYDIIQRTANQYEDLSYRTDALENSVGVIEGSASIQNDALIAAMVGKMQLVKNGNRVIGVNFIDGSLFWQDRDGQLITTGTLASDAADGVEEIQGSSLWTGRDKIVGVSGQFKIVTDPVTGNKRVVIISGGGMTIEKNNVEYGIYDSENLTGGLMVNKINNESDVQILGSKVNITASQMASLGIYTDSHYDGGFLIERINGEPEATISASRINLNGTVSLNDIMSVYETYAYMKGRMLIGNIGTGDYSFINGGRVYGDSFSFLGSPQSITLDRAGLAGMIRTATVNDSTNTLTLTKWDGSVINFRKASSAATKISDSWSSNLLRIVADDNGYDLPHTYEVKRGNMVWANDKKSVQVYGNFVKNPGAGTEYITYDAFSFSVPTTQAYNAGEAAGKEAVGLTSPVWTYSTSSVSSNERSANTVTVGTSGRTEVLQKSVDLFLTQDSSWSSNKKWVYMRSGSTSGSIYAKLQVDAQSVYDSGKRFGRQNTRIGTPATSLWNDYTVDLESTVTYTANGTNNLYFRIQRLNDAGDGYVNSGSSTKVYHLIVKVQVPSSSHSPSVTTNSTWYVDSGVGEPNAKTAAATAMSCSTSELIKIADGRFRSGCYVWFKVNCGGTNKFYYTKIN